MLFYNDNITCLKNIYFVIHSLEPQRIIKVSLCESMYNIYENKVISSHNTICENLYFALVLIPKVKLGKTSLVLYFELSNSLQLLFHELQL